MPKTVVVGVTGGIAAYKAVYLVSALKKRGYDVHVILTRSALEFVSALTFETVSQNAAITGTFKRTEKHDVQHVSLAKKADMFIIAPATANVIAKAASGIADDMLTTTLLAARCPVIFAPAMNTAMLEDTATQKNLEQLTARGYHVMPPDEGMLACGDVGAGRMREPDDIIAYMDEVFGSLFDMHGIRVMVSAGPTREPLDPVRYLSNRSSGKMGYAIAQAALDRGASVTLVSGPVDLIPPAKADVVSVVTAQEMEGQMMRLAKKADIIIMTAAVADYTPEQVQPDKIKKGGDITLALRRTQDILAALGQHKRMDQLLMGFAAETQNFEKNAKTKLASKNLDMIALNNVAKLGEGFGADDNNIKIFYADGQERDLGSAPKTFLAKQIIDLVRDAYQQKQNAE